MSDMPNRPTKERRNDCKDLKQILDLSHQLMDIYREELVEYLDGPDYEDEVVAHCNIDPDLFGPDHKSELADALNEQWQDSSGDCRQALIDILNHRTKGAELMADMIETLDKIDKRQLNYTKCLHKQD